MKSIKIKLLNHEKRIAFLLARIANNWTRSIYARQQSALRVASKPRTLKKREMHKQRAHRKHAEMHARETYYAHTHKV